MTSDFSLTMGQVVPVFPSILTMLHTLSGMLILLGWGTMCVATVAADDEYPDQPFGPYPLVILACGFLLLGFTKLIGA